MSFTVYKKKATGEMVPIKMSIWDAFHGAPNPKPKKKDHVSQPFIPPRSPPRRVPGSFPAYSTDAFQCSCCGKLHDMTDKARTEFEKDKCVRNGGTGVLGKQIAWQSNSDKNNKAQKSGDGDKKNAFSTSAKETFTEQDDVIIMQMKADGDSWAKILEAICKTSKSQVQARFKQLEGKPMPGKPDDKKPDENNKKGDKKSKAEKDKADGLKKQAEAKKEKDGKGKKDKSKGAEKKVRKCHFL